MKNKNFVTLRMTIITGIFILVMFLLLGNVFVISVFKIHAKSNTNIEKYVNKVNVDETLYANRGNIYSSDGYILATDSISYSLICFLDESRTQGDKIYYVADIDKTAKVLSEVLNIEYDYVVSQLSKDLYQVELGIASKNISKEQKEEIESYGLTGLQFSKTIQRVYPQGDFAPYIVGYTIKNEDDNSYGVMGIESSYNDYLTGVNGHSLYQSDERGYILDGMKNDTIEAIDGSNVYLTLDQEIQESLDTALNLTVENFDSELAWGAVMEVDTGRVLAWAQVPSFDPNILNITNYNNLGSQYPYEVGSVMKPFIYAAAIDSGNYDGDALVDASRFCYNFVDGQVKRISCSVGSPYDPIKNAYERDFGMIPYDLGLTKSSNVVTSDIMTNVITPDIYLDYVKKFGFFSSVETEIPDNAGVLHFKYANEKMSLGYGQGSSMTTLQLLQAYSAIMSDGTMKKPYFVEKVVDPYDNSVVYQAEPEISEPVIKAESASQLRDIMLTVIEDDEGTGKNFKMNNVRIIAKTGTSQVAVNGTYDSGKMISSIVVGLPYEDPKYIFYYAYEGDMIRGAHNYSEPELLVLNKIAMKYKLSYDEDDENYQDLSTKQASEFEMPSLINHSLQYVNSKLNGESDNLIIIGDGNSVIDQYPKAKTTILSTTKIFLITDFNTMKMPNMIGWTRDQIIEFWTLTGVQFEIVGSGVCVDQSIQPNTIINKNDLVKMMLE